MSKIVLSGAPDFSFLNHPLTATDRLFVRDGRFYRVGSDIAPITTDDERVRLFGVNFAFDAKFPLAGDAPRVARRLQKLISTQAQAARFQVNSMTGYNCPVERKSRPSEARASRQNRDQATSSHCS